MAFVERAQSLNSLHSSSSIEIEHRLRGMLDGVALVSEIDLDQDDVLAAPGVLEAAVQRGQRARLWQVAPAALVVTVVRHGVNEYEGNRFWEGLERWGLTSSQFGDQFLKALAKLGLERFDYVMERERGRRYVGQALLHGGIPKAAAAQVFDLLSEELRTGASDASEIVDRWRAGSETLERMHSKPVSRFIHEAGEVAVDLVDRMIDLLTDASIADDPALSALPSHLLAAFTEGESGRGRSRLRQARLPAATVVIDPGSMIGPTLVLPHDPSRLVESWRMYTGEEQLMRPSSTVGEQQVDLHPADNWKVTSCIGGTERTRSFRGHAPGVWLFGQDEELLQPERPVRWAVLYVLSPATFECRVGGPDGDLVTVVEDFGELSGSWWRYSLRTVDVTGIDTLYIGPSMESSHLASAIRSERSEGRSITLGAGEDRPAFLGREVSRVSWHGAPVFASTPYVRLPDKARRLDRWVVRATAHGCDAVQVRASELEMLDDRQLVLEGLIGDGCWSGEVSVRGPLGSDAKQRFAVVPDLHVTGLDQLHGPDAPVVLDASAHSSAELSPHQLRLSAPHDSAVLETRRFKMDIRVARLGWVVQSEQSRRNDFGAAHTQVGLDDLQDGSARDLLVRARPGDEVTATLKDPDDASSLMRLPTVRCGPRGIAAIPLRRLTQTAADAGKPHLAISIEVGDRQFEVATIIARYEAKVRSAEALTDGASTILDLVYEENRPFPGRVVRLWPSTRPWEDPIDLALGEADTGEAFLESDRLSPGRYALEILVPDPWSEPLRPEDGGFPLQVGTHADELAHIAALRPSDPLENFELLLDDPPRRAAVPAEHLPRVAPLALRFLVAEFRAGNSNLTDGHVRVARQLLFQDSDLAFRVLGNAAEAGMAPTDLRRTIQGLYRDLLDCPPEDLTDQERERFWRIDPVLGAAADTWPADWTSDAGCQARQRWMHHVGWDPSAFTPSDESTWPGHVRNLGPPALTFDQARLRQLRDALFPGKPLPLTDAAASDATLEWLHRRFELGNKPFEHWRSKYRVLNDRRVRNGIAASLLDRAKPQDDKVLFARYVEDALAVAFWHGRAMEAAREAPRALEAIWSASELTPLLTQQALLLALITHRTGA